MDESTSDRTQIHGGAWREERTAAAYLEGVRGAIPLAAEQIDVLRRLARAQQPPPERILDLGCGDGVLAAALLELFPAAQAVLVDVSEAMLAAAPRRFGRGAEGVEYVLADYGDPQWVERLGGERPFDIVVSGFSIHHQPDDNKRRIYREIFYLLAPGGLFFNLEHVSSASQRLERICDERMIDACYAYHLEQGGGDSREEVARRYYYRDDKQENILAPLELQLGWLREIGFEDVDCFLKIFELAAFGGRRPRPGPS